MDKNVISFLNCTILEGGKYFKMNFLTISAQVVTECGVRELNDNLAAPYKEKGNNLGQIVSSKTQYCLYESQMAINFGKHMCGFSLSNLLNYPTHYNINLSNIQMSKVLLIEILSYDLPLFYSILWDILSIFGSKAIDLLFFAFVYTIYNQQKQYNKYIKILTLAIKEKNNSPLTAPKHLLCHFNTLHKCTYQTNIE